jgi:DNA-binding SARP family transcriptional activator
MEFSIGSVTGPVPRRIPVRRRVAARRPLSHGQLLTEVFDILPGGVMVVSAAGRLVTWNAPMSELLGGTVESGSRCCDLFGCRTPGTDLAEGCITELALQRLSYRAIVESPAHPGLRLELAARGFTRNGSGRVVIRARPIDQLTPDAAPAESEPAPALASDPVEKIRIRVLGETVVELSSGEVREDWLDQRAGRLLKLLIAHRHAPMHADTIAEALWPHARADSTNTVRHFIHALREKLEPERARYQRSKYVVSRNGGYQLNPERVVIDADEFEQKTADGLRAFARGDREHARESLTQALALYQGDFLEAERFEDWAFPERERLRELVAKPLRALVELTDDPGEATSYLEQLADLEPLDVEVQRELITAWLQQGRRGRAIRHYRALQSRLMRELGERVAFDLGELARSNT